MSGRMWMCRDVTMTINCDNINGIIDDLYNDFCILHYETALIVLAYKVSTSVDVRHLYAGS